ncbi:MAG: hypothetical protein R2878_04835 [Thermoleophilia bacterium]
MIKPIHTISALAVMATLANPAAAALHVNAAPGRLTTDLGRTVTFTTTITADPDQASGPLIAHLNIMSLRPGVYVDPEDWSADRTRYLSSLPAGTTQTLRWSVKAVGSGTFGAYASFGRPTGSAPPTASPVVTVDVAGRRTLNPSGIGPLAIGVPVLLAIGAGAIRLRRRLV